MAPLPLTRGAHVPEAAGTIVSPFADTERTVSLSDLRGSAISPTIWYRIHVFLFDLRHYSQRIDSEARLERIPDSSYIGPPYFEPGEAEALRNTVTHEKKLSQVIEEALEERLNRRMKKRVSS